MERHAVAGRESEEDDRGGRNRAGSALPAPIVAVATRAILGDHKALL